MSFPPNYDPNWPDIRLKDRLEGSFQDLPSLIEALNSRGMGFRPKYPTLRLSPKEPPRPEMPHMVDTVFGTQIPRYAPPRNKDWVFTGDDENDVKANWYKIGSPITESDVGPSTYKKLSAEGTPVFKAEHHGKYLGSGRPTATNDITNFEHTRALHGINPPNIPNIPGGKVSLEQAQEVYHNWKNYQADTGKSSELNPHNNPTRLDGSVVNDAEAKSLRQWGDQNLENQANNASLVNRLGTGNNPMTINNMSQASNLSGAESNQITKTATQGAGRAGSMMSRAMPMIGLALLANSMIQNSRANTKRAEDAATERRMET